MFGSTYGRQGGAGTDPGAYSCPGREEKAALRRGRKAEWRFRVSRGYERDTLWNRLKFRFNRK